MCVYAYTYMCMYKYIITHPCVYKCVPNEGVNADERTEINWSHGWGNEMMKGRKREENSERRERKKGKDGRSRVIDGRGEPNMKGEEG